jgi:ABC-2 type transport system permease protein
MVIPPDFATHVDEGDATVLMLVDGSNSYTTASAYNAANSISQQYAVSLLNVSGEQGSPLTAHVQILYNPDLNDLWFITPAFIAMLLQAVAQNLTGLSIVRERERGTIEALLVTPVRPFEIVIAKMIPNLLLAFADAFFMMVVSTYILKVPFRGDIVVFSIVALLTCCCGLSIGLMISSAVQTQNQAYQLNSLVNISGMFLAGVMFPAYALPVILRGLSFIFPMTYFIPVLRGIALKGIGFGDIWLQVVALIGLLAVTLTVAVRLFRQRLD